MLMQQFCITGTLGLYPARYAVHPAGAGYFFQCRDRALIDMHQFGRYRGRAFRQFITAGVQVFAQRIRIQRQQRGQVTGEIT